MSFTERKVHFVAKKEERSRSCEDRRQSTINPYMLPEFDEETYDHAVTQEPPGETPSGTDRQNLRNKTGVMSFKKIAKAITKQRKWSNILKASL